jgi:hypothetical protein
MWLRRHACGVVASMGNENFLEHGASARSPFSGLRPLGDLAVPLRLRRGRLDGQ